MSRLSPPIVATRPALSGEVRLNNNGWVSSRNNANTADVNLIRLNTSDIIEISTLLKINPATSGIGAYGASPTPQPTGWQIQNAVALRSLDASLASLTDVVNAFGTLVADLKLQGWLGG